MKTADLAGLNEKRPAYIFVFNGGDMKIKVKNANAEFYLCRLLDAMSTSYRIESNCFSDSYIISNILSSEAEVQSSIVVRDDMVVGSTQSFRHSQFRYVGKTEPAWVSYSISDSLLKQVYSRPSIKWLLLKCDGFHACFDNGSVHLRNALILKVKHYSRENVMYLSSTLDIS